MLDISVERNTNNVKKKTGMQEASTDERGKKTSGNKVLKEWRN